MHIVTVKGILVKGGKAAVRIRVVRDIHRLGMERSRLHGMTTRRSLRQALSPRLSRMGRSFARTFRWASARSRNSNVIRGCTNVGAFLRMVGSVVCLTMEPKSASVVRPDGAPEDRRQPLEKIHSHGMRYPCHLLSRITLRPPILKAVRYPLSHGILPMFGMIRLSCLI